MEIAKAYTNTLEILNQCNYIFSDTTNARDALLSCINQPNQENPIDDNFCLNSNTPLIEGFSMDNNNMLTGPGVGYTEIEKCEDGVNRTIDGKCSYQKFSGRKRDGDWQRSMNNGEIMHLFKEVFEPCKTSRYTISSNGYFVCEGEEVDVKEEIIEGFDGSSNSVSVPSVVLDSEEIPTYQSISGR